MSMRRVMPPAASLVWTVENTRWPVSDAVIATSAVSRSRISPTMMTSGSWRRNERGRDAHVDVLAGHLAPDPAVLRQPLLGDVEPGHDLDARGDRRLELLGRALGLAQHAVDPVADDHVLLAGLDVDVRRALLGGLEHQRVDPADDRRLVVGVEHVDQLLGLELGVLLV